MPLEVFLLFFACLCWLAYLSGPQKVVHWFAPDDFIKGSCLLLVTIYQCFILSIISSSFYTSLNDYQCLHSIKAKICSFIAFFVSEQTPVPLQVALQSDSRRKATQTRVGTSRRQRSWRPFASSYFLFLFCCDFFTINCQDCDIRKRDTAASGTRFAATPGLLSMHTQNKMGKKTNSKKRHASRTRVSGTIVLLTAL